jgi:putative tryptophan/tyrosine transport system substrate-binding protein
MNATAASGIPVVFASAGDPVKCGLVASLAAPGGNVTGCRNMQTDDSTVHYRVGVMKNKLAPIKKVVVIGNNPPNEPLCAIDEAMDKALYWLNYEQIAAVGKAQGRWAASDFQSKQAVLAKLAPLAEDGVLNRVLVCSDPVVSANVRYVIAAAHDLGMKTMHEFREHVDAPNYGDQCYGASFQGLFEQAAGIVDKILGGTAPSAIPVQRPQAYDEVP